MLRLPVLIAAVGLSLLAGCGSPEDVVSGVGSQAEYLLCTEPAGSWTDLTDEDEAWRANALAIAWTDASRCAIRLDTVWHSFADEHCGWEDVENISMGLPLGTPYTGPDAQPPGQDWDPSFLFNTDGAVDHLPPGETIAAADVPGTAIDTGLQTITNRRLFLAEDESALYEVQGESARVFVRTLDDEFSCA